MKRVPMVEQPSLTAVEERALRRAVAILEGNSFVSRLTEMTGEPVTQLLKRLPAPITRQLNQAVRLSLTHALKAALYKMRPASSSEPGPILFQVASGVTGGVSGFFGMGALAVELPVTTTLMLRSIAGIAVRHGEQMDQLASRLACLEVLALGPHGKHGASGETSYYAARTFLAKTVSEAAQGLAQRTVAGTSAPAIVELVSVVGSRFGLVVSDKAAASAVPVVGAIGGAAINLAFMRHFQELARAHFVVRQLERRHGTEYVRIRYRRFEELRKPSG